MIDYLVNNKPILVGLHLGFAILGIDGFIWLFGEILARSENRFRIVLSGVLGVAGFALSWLIGGFYYVKFYGTIVKPIIKAGSAPWAHAIAMEAKEHIFLFIIPMAFTAVFVTLLGPLRRGSSEASRQVLENSKIRKPLIVLIAMIALIGLSLGAMGFIISAAARWA